MDAFPIEGFNPEEYDKILDLAAKGLASVLCCAAGYRALATNMQRGKKCASTART